MWKLHHKGSCVPKNWWFWTVVLEKTTESPFTARRSKQSVLKEISPEYSLKTDVEAETPVFCPPDGKNWLIGKHLDERLKAGGEGVTEDKMVGWHHWLYVIESLNSMSLDLSKLLELVFDREAWCAAIHGFSKSQTWLSNWTEQKMTNLFSTSVKLFFSFISTFYYFWCQI